jgi:DNA helicase HerA-like ATPase
MPPNPGSKVYLPYPEFLEDVFSRDTNGQRFEHALHLGTLDSSAVDKAGKVRQLNFFLDGDGLIKQHILISGMSGAGKTYLASVLVEELANKVGCPVVVMDPHGEYSSIGVPDSGFKALLQKGGVSAEDYSFGFKVSVHACDAVKLRSEFEKWGVDLEQPRRFSVEPVLERWKGSSDEKDEADFSDVLRHGIKPRVVTVVDSRGISFEDRARLFECCANALLNGRLRGEVPPFVLLVDETSLLSDETLRMIASEGRRLGVSMCLLSQHPAEIGGEVLSQMGGQMIGRTTEAEDLESLRAMAGEKAGLLSELKRGEWVVNGMMIRQPVKVHLRDRYSIHP